MILRICLCINILICFTIKDLKSQPIDLLNKLKSEWINDYNEENKLNDIAKLYLEGGAVFSNGKFFNNNEIINALSEVKKSYPAIENFQTIDYFENDPENYFEMGKYTLGTAGTDTLYYIIAWKKNSENWFRELEIIYPKFNTIAAGNELTAIDTARKKWVKVANTNNPEELVRQLYTEDAVYFNNKSASYGQKEISLRYGFMSNPGWKMMSLTSQKTILIQNELAFEVGKWQMTSFAGLYLLVWKKVDDVWKAVLDFNF